ncbi:hypothetical protein ELQ39_10830 [Streptomyces sp. GB4-14]|nr:hypothetical protein [Streptomyces sp. GB4-14]
MLIESTVRGGRGEVCPKAVQGFRYADAGGGGPGEFAPPPLPVPSRPRGAPPDPAPQAPEGLNVSPSGV